MIFTINELQMRGLSELYDDSAGAERLGNANRTFEEADTSLTQAEKNAAGDVDCWSCADICTRILQCCRGSSLSGKSLNASSIRLRKPSTLSSNVGQARAPIMAWVAYMLRGDIGRAEKEIHSALELAPDYEPAKQDLQQIENLKKEKKQP